MDHLIVAGQLDGQRTQIVDRAVMLALRNPFWAERFGPEIGERLALDYDMILAAVSKAIRYRSPLILCDHIRWRRDQLVDRGCPSGHLREAFGYKWSAIRTLLPAEALPTISAYFELAIDTLDARSTGARR